MPSEHTVHVFINKQKFDLDNPTQDLRREFRVIVVTGVRAQIAVSHGRRITR